MPVSVFAQINYGDTSSIAVFQLDTSNWRVNHLKNNQPVILRAEQIYLADSILNICIFENENNYDFRGMQKGGRIGEFLVRKKQMVPSINKSGEIVVWVNCICINLFNPEEKNLSKKKQQKKDDWKKELIIIRGGGGCNFNVMVNLAKKEYFDLFVNGY
jgi:hypothetical protein